MDSFKALWREYELLQEENEKLLEELKLLQERILDCLDMLQQGQTDAAMEILTGE